MRKGISILLFSMCLSTVAFGGDENKEVECNYAGEAVMASWHKLNFCLAHRRLDQAQVAQIKKMISSAYPKLAQEINNNGHLSLYAKGEATGLPYDFSQDRNAELLTNICNSAMGAFSSWTGPDAQKTLWCWK